jgi:hypothetical protein
VALETFLPPPQGLQDRFLFFCGDSEDPSMRTNLARTLIALGMLLGMLAPVAAEDLRFSGLDRRAAGASPRRAPIPAVRQMAHMSDIAASDEILPGDAMPMDDSMYQPMDSYGSGSCGSCDSGNSCGNSCCDSGACCGGYGYQSGCGGCYPDCGGCYSDGGGCYSECGGCYPDCGGCPPSRGMFYGETQLMLLRAHVAEEVVGKLSESHTFSPRFIFGYEACSGIGARTRFWIYDEDVSILDAQGTKLGLDWNVIDVEGTARFRTDRADLIVGCGFRWADANLEVDQFSISSDMPGVTLALDGRAWICQSCTSQWSAVCGARWSVLGGDWEGENAGGNDVEWRDDNILVQELYGGFEYLRYYGNWNVFARLVFEAQNWRSDALGTNNIGIGANPQTDYSLKSIGFLGPGIHVGATF